MGMADGCGLLPGLPGPRLLTEDELASLCGIRMGSALTFGMETCRFGTCFSESGNENGSLVSVEGVIAKPRTAVGGAEGAWPVDGGSP